MDRIAFPALAALVFLGGCVNTHNVSRDQARLWVEGAQHNLDGEEVTLVATSGARYQGTVASLDEQSILLRQEGVAQPTSFALDTVHSVATPRNVAPAIGGVLLGVILGGVIGGAAAAEEPDPNVIGANTFASATGGALVGGLIGGAAGAVVLGLLTASDSYIIAHPPARKKTAAPADSTATRR